MFFPWFSAMFFLFSPMFFLSRRFMPCFSCLPYLPYLTLPYTTRQALCRPKDHTHWNTIFTVFLIRSKHLAPETAIFFNFLSRTPLKPALPSLPDHAVPHKNEPKSSKRPPRINLGKFINFKPLSKLGCCSQGHSQALGLLPRLSPFRKCLSSCPVFPPSRSAALNIEILHPPSPAECT